MKKQDDGKLGALGVDAQLAAWHARVTDPRAVVPTGWAGVDSNLRRGGFAPSTLAILGGRTGTRKTTVMVNMVANILDAGFAVGVVGLDESPVNYVAKVASAMFRVDDELLENSWTGPFAEDIKAQYRERARRLTVAKGYRPDFDLLSYWLDEAALGPGGRPQVVFIDYTSLLERNKYDGGEMQRVSRLIEGLHVWTKRHELVTIGLHQVGRQDDMTSNRYHGASPMTTEALKYGGEETADIIFGTFRPAKDPLGKMSQDIAQATLGDKFDQEKWEEARARVERYRDSTFLQLLKNRPGRRLDEEGLELKSIGDSQAMVPATEMVTDGGLSRPYGED